MNRDSNHTKDICILAEMITTCLEAKTIINREVKDCFSYEVHDEAERLVEQLNIFIGVFNSLMITAAKQEYPYDQEEE